MKKIIPVLLFLFNPFVSVFAETYKVEINWLFPKEITLLNGQKTFALNFSDADFLAEKNYVPSKSFELKGDVSFLKVTSFTSEALNPVEANLVNSNFLSSSIDIQKNIISSAGSKTTQISFVPLIYNQQLNVAEKITSVTFEYITTQPTTFSTLRSVSLRTANLATSVLASGEWYKISVKDNGIYKITYNDLKAYGINPDVIDPRKIKIYGNEGGMLPQLNSDPRPFDLNENNIQVIGENDGVFNKEDYILFYGEGPNKIKFDQTANVFTHEMNLYSTENFYFLTIGSENGKRITTASPPATTDISYSYYDAYDYHEEEKLTFLSTGRTWFGENITKNSYTFSLKNLALEPSSTVIASASAMVAATLATTNINYKINGSSIGFVYYNPVSSDHYGTKGIQKTETYFLNSDSYNSTTWNFSATYDALGDKEAESYVDYFSFNYRNKIAYNGFENMNCIDCRNYTSATFNFDQQNSAYSLWDITDLYNVTSIPISNATAKFETNGKIKNFAFFTSSDFNSPIFVSKIANQDLKSETTAPDLVIVTHPKFIEKANELADFKRNTIGLKVVVATTDEVYNEFSSGRQDISAIRDYTRYLHQKSTDKQKLKFLLLIGDCSYDYKDINKANSNFLPVYQSRESLHNVNSYSSDDYYTFLDDNEGTWEENGNGNHGLDISVGRLPVQTEEQAEILIKKIENYSQNPSTLGKWRNNIILVADDEDNNLHVGDADELSGIIGTNAPSSNIKKIYLDSYTTINTAGGKISPAATESLLDNIDNGALLVNYTGHGSDKQWAKEKIITTEDIQKMRNYDRLPFFMTATCEFGRYDDPTVTSGGETLVLAENGGAIGALTTTRPVYASSNFAINKAFYKYVFEPNANGTRPAIGEIMQNTKNASHIGVNNRNFSLLGDPSIILAFPYYSLEIDSINNQTISVNNPDTVKALGEIKMQGKVLDLLGNHLSDFNGKISVSVYDKFSEKKTLGQGINAVYNYKVQENKLFEGKASVENGRFSFSFVVPKDISYNYAAGKISLYASQPNSSFDAGGYNTNIIIGGTDKNAPQDDAPPTVSLFMDDSSFVEGGIVNPNTTLKAFVKDDNGINTATSGIGHEMTAVLDGGTPIILNNYYESDENTYKTGRVYYDFKNLAPGEHKITFKAWDTHNNSTEKTVKFSVEGLRLIVTPYPNPFQDVIHFVFEQNRFNKDILVQLNIYDIQGAIVKTMETEITASDFIVDKIEWDGKTNNGTSLNSGMYLYKLDVIYKEDLIQLTKTGKIIYNN